MTRIISCYNNKGGSRKTTSNVELSVLLAKKGFKVALVDLDPQGNATFNLGDETTNKDFRAYAEDRVSLSEIKQKVNENLDLYPTNPNNKLDQLSDSVFSTNPLFFHKKFYNDISKEGYDFIFIDLSPVLGRMNRLILSIVEEIIITLDIEVCNLLGMTILENDLDIIRRDLSIYDSVLCDKILFCGFNSSIGENKRIVEEVIEWGSYNLFVIPQRSFIKDLRAEKKTSIDSKKTKDITESYQYLADWFAEDKNFHEYGNKKKIFIGNHGENKGLDIDIFKAIQNKDKWNKSNKLIDITKELENVK